MKTVQKVLADSRKLRAKLRSAAQILVQELGIDEPCSAEHAARCAVRCLREMRAEIVRLNSLKRESETLFTKWANEEIERLKSDRDALKARAEAVEARNQLAEIFRIQFDFGVIHIWHDPPGESKGWYFERYQYEKEGEGSYWILAAKPDKWIPMPDCGCCYGRRFSSAAEAFSVLEQAVNFPLTKNPFPDSSNEGAKP